MIHAAIEPTFEAFREAARPLLASSTPPANVFFEDRRRGQVTLSFGDTPASRSFGDTPELRSQAERTRIKPKKVNVPARAVELAKLASFHRDGDRFELLYRVFYRLTHGEPYLLDVASDADTLRLRRMVQSVKHDEHKMHAFVRFRKVDVVGEAEPWFVAWHRPEHPLLRLTAPFFQRRFPSMRWSLLTPQESVHWDMSELHYGPGVPREDAPPPDAFEEMFLTYYKAIFNPARVNLDVMQAMMPKRFWSTMPETAVIGDLARSADTRVQVMKDGGESASSAFIPKTSSLAVLKDAIPACRACDLCLHATQPVFGELGTAQKPVGTLLESGLFLVGEQPGDEEDKAGRPFIGPAGKVLDRALEEAGIDRSTTYLTNAVKHFKFEPRGKRRIHQRPAYGEVRACRGWLDAELEIVKPKVIVALGSTAAQSFLGKRFQVSKRRGQIEKTRFCDAWVATWHPSAILRAPDESSKERMFEELVADLALAKSSLERAA